MFKLFHLLQLLFTTDFFPQLVYKNLLCFICFVLTFSFRGTQLKMNCLPFSLLKLFFTSSKILVTQYWEMKISAGKTLDFRNRFHAWS